MLTMKKLKSNSIQKVEENLPDVKKEKMFRPTPHMLVWLDTQINLAIDNKAEIARQANIAEKTWYEWLKIPEFEDWYWAEYDKKTRRWKPSLDVVGLKFAKQGSSKHFELMMKRVGNIKENGSSVNVQNNWVVEIGDYPMDN